MPNLTSAEPKPKPLFVYACTLSVATFLLLIAGGLVTSHEAGLAVPDWPLSYGQFFPPMVGNIFWEHGHRMIAGFVGLLTLGFVIMAHIVERRTWYKHLTKAMLAAVVLQALLGGITVLLMLPPAVSIMHACLGQTFFCLTIAAAYFSSPEFFNWHPENGKKFSLGFFKLARMTAIFIFLQLILGATVRHTSHGVVFHMIGAALVIVHMMFLILRSHHEASEKASMVLPVTTLGCLGIIQIALGLGSWMLTRMHDRGFAPTTLEVVFTASHQSLGALILGLSFWIALRARE